MKHALWRVLGRKGVMPENSSFKEMVLWKLSVSFVRNICGVVRSKVKYNLLLFRHSLLLTM